MKLKTMAAVALAAGSALAYTRTTGPQDDLLKVRDEIRAARAAGTIKAGEPVTVTLAPGTYVLKDPLVFAAADAGTETAPVTWRAERSGTVRFLGGKAVPRAAFAPVTGAAAPRRRGSTPPCATRCAWRTRRPTS